MTSKQQLTEKQQAVISQLPASKQEIANNLNIKTTTVRGRIQSIREKEGKSSIVYQNGQYVWCGDPEKRRISSKHKGTKTREANETITELESQVLRRIRNIEPLRTEQEPTPNGEDVLFHFSDLHIGDRVEDEFGRDIYNPAISVASAQQYTQNALKLVSMMEDSGVNTDTAHLCWGGDMITNENIYDGQQFHIELKLVDQMSLAVRILTQQAMTLADRFDNLQIVAIPGNHGKDRASGTSEQANMDLVVYRWVHDRLDDKGYDNINFVVNESGHYKNFYTRGGKQKGHLVHGEFNQVHADSTSKSQGDWRGWAREHTFDFALRGHLHQPRVEHIQNEEPVIMAPSPKPGGDFASKIGNPDVSTRQKLGWVFGINDDRPVTWQFLVDEEPEELQRIAETDEIQDIVEESTEGGQS